MPISDIGPHLRREDGNRYVSKMSEEHILDVSVERRSAPIVATLPDGKRLEFSGPVTGCEMAAAIGPGLAKAAIPVRLDGRPPDPTPLLHQHPPTPPTPPPTPPPPHTLPPPPP